MKSIKNRSNKLLWMSLLIFIIGYLIIIGYYWLFGGHFGNSRFTISIFVGLQTWSTLLFCVVNVIVSVLLIIYLITQTKANNFLWRFLMFSFIVAYIGLSIAAKTPDNAMSTEIHQFFSHSLFIIITLISFLTIIVAQDKITRFLASLLLSYGAFFIVCYVIKADFFMAGILWYESAFIFAFFALTIVSNRLQAKVDD